MFLIDFWMFYYFPVLDFVRSIYQVYWPKHADIDKILKVECTPILGETEYPSIFAISSPVSRGI